MNIRLINKILLGSITFLTFSNSTLFADNIDATVRVLIPISEGSTLDDDKTDSGTSIKTIKSPTTEGLSAYYIFPQRFGIGQTFLETSYEVQVKSTSSGQLPLGKIIYTEVGLIEASYLDFYYTWGDSFRITLGYGIMIDGERRATRTISSEAKAAGLGVKSSKSSSATGSSKILHISYKIESFDLLAGYRSNNYSFTFGKTTETANTNQVSLGLGYIF